MRKKFDKELYSKYDTLAKKTALDIFKNFAPYSIKESANKTDVDFKILNNGVHVGYLEVEIKKLWLKDFIYSTIQFPERKWKYCVLDKPTIFMMFNSDCTNYLTVIGEDLIKSPLEMVRNKYINFGENFFKVPLDKVLFNNINFAYLEKK